MVARCPAISPNRLFQCAAHADTDHIVHVDGTGKNGWRDAVVNEPLYHELQLPWPRIALSGARKMSGAHGAMVGKILAELVEFYSPCVFVLGGAEGFDAYAALSLISHYAYDKVHVHVVLPADHTQVDKLWRAHCHTHEQMPVGTSYQQRNVRMSDISEWSYAFPWHTKQQMGHYLGGTWRFIEYAQRMHKMTPSDIFVLEPVAEFR